MTTIETPCIEVCVVEPDRGLCVGCGRSVVEIARWTAMSAGERRCIMALLPERLRALTLQPSHDP